MVRRATQDFEVSVSPVQSIKVFRLLAEEAGWSMERHEGSRMVDRFAIIMPMTQTTRTLGLRILDGPLRGLEVTSWAETRGSSGALNMISWVLPGGLEVPLTQLLLQHWVARLPRCPWRWSFGERSKIGFLLPVWKKSRKNFAKLGFSVGKNDWPNSPEKPWMDSESE
ncbi:MAG: hypothetical protein HN765_03670 [Euryarchaeota archaeon]|jgi:hypothetical protein|nr:hypothetical protein [Euryarchaeota archaeon]MBT7961026.1 hypothetical protein [Euryarchaeota archaeon]